MSVSGLFEPLPLIHGKPMRNRFMLAPLTNQQSEYDGSASKYDIDWMEQVARGGYALAQTAATFVEPSGIAFERQLGIYSDDLLPGLTDMADALREGDTLSAVQLHHAGHRARPELGGHPSPASGYTVPGYRALTTEEVQRIRDSFIEAAERAERAGFDGIAAHGAFGWILSEFMSPLLNDRTDQYGGSPENRARLTLEVLEGIRRECGPDFQIGWRLSVERYGLQLEELVEITADILDRELIDYLDLALWESKQIVQEGRYCGKTMVSVFAELPRKRVALGVAGKIYTAERAGQLLDEGADFILVARAGILQRDFPLQVQANHAYERVRTPVPAQHLRNGGLSERFINHMRGWPAFVQRGSL